MSIKASGPFVIYFCSEQLAKTAGVGTDAIRALKKPGAKPVKETIFEENVVLDAFKKAGINDFYKVAAIKENVELANKYRVACDNTLVFCAPDGDSVVTLAGDQCSQTNVLKVLKTWKEIYEAWQKKAK